MAVPSELVAVHRYAPEFELPTLVRTSVDVSPMEVMETCAEGAMTVLSRVQVKDGGGLPFAEQEKFAVPPLGVTASVGCRVMEGEKG